MPRRIENRSIRQLSLRFDGAQHKSSATHITASNEFAREQQALTESLQQGLDILGRRDAAEENDVTPLLDIFGDTFGQHPAAEVKRVPITAIIGFDLACSHLAHLLESDDRLRVHQTGGRGNYVRTREPEWRCRKGSGIRKLAAKVEAAEESEQISQRNSAVAQTAGQVRLSVVPENIARTNPGKVCGGKQENSVSIRHKEAESTLLILLKNETLYCQASFVKTASEIDSIDTYALGQYFRSNLQTLPGAGELLIRHDLSNAGCWPLQFSIEFS